MRDAELDPAARLWSLPAQRTKNGRPHEVPLSDAAIAIIGSLPKFAGSDYMFTGTGRTPFSGFSRGLARLKTAMTSRGKEETPHWTLHDLRRTAATGMAGLGIAPHIIEAAMNHVSGSRAGIAGVYNRHHHSDEKRAALDTWAFHIKRIVNK